LFDRAVLETYQQTKEINAELIGNAIGATRWQVAQSLARLGKRGFLTG
jgi:hypothetical protein